MIHFYKTVTDGAFSIETGLEPAGVVGPFVGPDRYTTCTKSVVQRGNADRLSDACVSFFLTKRKKINYL